MQVSQLEVCRRWPNTASPAVNWTACLAYVATKVKKGLSRNRNDGAILALDHNFYMDSRLRVARGIAKTETAASREVFETLKTRGHPDALSPTMSDGWGGIDDAMIAVDGQAPILRPRPTALTQKQPQPGWQYLQLVKHRNERGRLINTELRVI